jgi:gamma-glutamyltranspeptidase
MRNPNGPVTGRPPVRAERGMVSTSHYLASSTGLSVLRRGGSAVDAAIAANAVLCVAYPHMAGLGGDAFFLVSSPGQPLQALNASGPAAQAATRDYYAQRGHTDAIPGRGPLAALTVPGAVDGWAQAHQRYGRLDWSELFLDAVYYARSGVPVSRSLEEWTAQDVPLLKQHTQAAQLFLPDGQAVREGQRLRNEGLAESFELIAQHGARGGFYEGELAGRICAALVDGGSPLRPEDFAAFSAEWVDPISTTYRGHTAYEFPPNTQGFAALQVLNLLEGYDVAAIGDGTADYYHYAAEAVKLAFADRDAWLTDPASLDIPLESLIDRSYADERRNLIDPERAMVMEEVKPGIDAGTAAVGRGAEGDTCSICAVDDDGMAVSLIESVYHDFGSAEIAGDTGILLQNRGSFFSLDENHPNRLEPGKRTFHTLIPAMVMDSDNTPELVYGTMGGEGQPQTHAALLTRLIDFGYDVQQAIEAPRWLMGRTWGTKSQDLSLEGRISDGVIRELERRGQPVKVLADWDDNMGHAQAIRIDRRNGYLEGGADPRGDGLALGW